MKEKFLGALLFQMKNLSAQVRNGYFTLDDCFDYVWFRKYQWKLYGMVDTAYIVGLLTDNESDMYIKHIRRIGKHYINSLQP